MLNPRESFRPIAFMARVSVACLLLCGISSAAPSINLSKKSGPPTSRILVSGSGFEPNVGVDIFFDTKDRALVVTNGKGEFHGAGIHAPGGARPGQHWVTALERNDDKGAQQPFLVQTDWSQFRFDADGTRLNPFENVLNRSNVGSLDRKWCSVSTGGDLSSPAVVNGIVYVGGEPNVYALNASTGAVLWSYDTGFSVNGSPAVANGVVFFGGGATGSLYALDASTGTKLWSYDTGAVVYPSPVVANGVVYFGSSDNSVYALNAKTGAKVWSYATGNRVVSSPTLANGVVYVGSDDFNVYALDASNGALLWSYKTGGIVQSSPTVANDVVYVGSDDKNVYALDSAGGTLWSYTTGGPVGSSPAVANRVVYVGSDDGNLYALDAGTGTKLWSYTTGYGGNSWSSPTVANGVVYVGSDAFNLYGLDARTGAELWSYFSSYGVLSSPAVVNGTVYAVVYPTHVCAFGLERRMAEHGVSSNRPDLKTLRPDFNLKVSKPAATPSAAEL